MLVFGMVRLGIETETTFPEVNALPTWLFQHALDNNKPYSIFDQQILAGYFCTVATASAPFR